MRRRAKWHDSAEVSTHTLVIFSIQYDACDLSFLAGIAIIGLAVEFAQRPAPADRTNNSYSRMV